MLTKFYVWTHHNAKILIAYAKRVEERSNDSRYLILQCKTYNSECIYDNKNLPS